MKVVFRGLVLAVGLIIALGIIKWLFVKLFFFALWAAFIGIVLYLAYSILKTA